MYRGQINPRDDCDKKNNHGDNVVAFVAAIISWSPRMAGHYVIVILILHNRGDNCEEQPSSEMRSILGKLKILYD